MRAWSLTAWVLTLVGLGATGRAQPSGAPEREALLCVQFRCPLSYEAALTRLGAYYQEQVGRILPLTFPEIAPRRHFEVWHDIFVSFDSPGDSAGGPMTVTLKRPTEGIGARLVKSWMVNLAGRLEAPMPLDFKEQPALHKAETEIYASRKDLARAMEPESPMKGIDSWEHAGLMVSAAPLTWVVLAPSGAHGVHHLTVETEAGGAAARQILARLVHGASGPGIHAAYSEEAEIAGEVRDLAGSQSAAAGVTSSQAVYVPTVDEKHREDVLRAEPEMMKRTAAAQGQYSIRFRVDRSYRKVTVSWLELAGYSRPSGRYQAERALGQSTLPNPRVQAPGAAPLTARTKLQALQSGAYRIRLEGEDSEGGTARIDERTYWFDGKTFEER